MAENSDSDTTPSFLSSLPDQPITDDIVKQIGESDHPKIHGAMGFPGSTPGTIEAFLLNMEEKTHVLVFDPSEERWCVYESFDNTKMDHQEMIDHANEIANEWFAESLSDRITAAEETED
ncbi:hypothetical protein ACFQJ7_08485 [Halovenus rubra]|uniref:DUF7964 domain-containing protein n=2 Tax=Halovenus rubra TaxID=869890 RepID=A0ABD5X7S5_9EURY|nr:hypothetical protein [Halovenus rubra]